MQVTETHDHVNHAIIGGKESIAFGISNSPEFFAILSSTLFKDQMLAVVREVMCNAWDIHIECGITDKPIVVTINSEHFMVQDFGSGIHHEDIGPIYGIYGNSTKKNDGTQTGGFGLGCKSPFAYTDHFEVTSCNAGIKTIYRMSKSLVQVDSKPGIVPIASFPTDETGLTVKIGLKNTYDQNRFRELIKRIAFNGEMNIELNGTKLGTLGFDDKVKPYMIYRGLNLIETTTVISVRYGNVIYPVDTNGQKALSDTSQRVYDFLRKFNNASRYMGEYHILFQAPAHSLSITPSRESLSMQEHTIKTLEQLFTNFLDDVDKHFTHDCDEFAKAAVEKAVTDKAYHRLLDRTPKLPVESVPQTSVDRISDFKTAAKMYMSVYYPKELKFRKFDWKLRIKLMMEKNLLDRGLAQTWLRELDEVSNINDDYKWNYQGGQAPWLGQRIIRPLIGKLIKGNLDPDKLFVVDSSDGLVGIGNKRSYSDGVVPAKNVNPKHHITTASYLRNIIVLSRRRKDIHDRAIQHEVFKKFGLNHGYLFYHVGLKQEEIRVAREFFAKTRMTVVDLIDRQPWEPAEPEKKVYATKARRKGIPMIADLLDGSRLDTKRGFFSDIDLIEKPEFIIRSRTGRAMSENTLGFLDNSSSVLFAQMFGKRGGIVYKDTQEETYIKKGAVKLAPFLFEQVIDYFVNHEEEIQKFWSCSGRRCNDGKALDELGYEEQKLYSLIKKVPDLRDLYNPPSAVLDATGRAMLSFYDRLVDTHWVDEDQRFKDLQEALSKIEFNADAQALIKKLKGNKMVESLNFYYIENAFRTTDTDLQKKLVDMVINVLEN